MSTHRVLLPPNIKPKVYDITLQPDLVNCTFKGSEKISFKLHEKTNKLVLNSKLLKVSNCQLNSSISPSKTEFDAKNDYIIFHFEKEITEDGVISLDFEGKLEDNMTGFYRSKYTDLDGNTKYCATTQFESTAARRCFPCWDEPAVKAQFDVTLVVPDNRLALSNMNCTTSNSAIEKDAKGDKLKTVKFARSPIMSTYLLAFVVGEFDFVEGKTKDGLPIRVFTPLGKKEQGLFGLDVCSKVIPLFQDYFKEKYPLPKLDLIAIPDFAAGAMENWGLITYRETALLFDEKKSSSQIKQRIALVVAHECAHMWFGNLVTMEWWDDLWLNEGFATWVEYLAIDEIFPEWNVFEQFVDGEFASAQSLDSLVNSHPIQVDVSVGSDIDQIFDGISYAKGCAVIRMLAEYVSLDVFKNSLRKYLSKYKYQNAATIDLWTAVSQESKKDIGTLMQNWTGKTGYPVLNLKELTSSDEGFVKGFRNIQVSQTRFFSDSSAAEKQKDDTVWKIPLGYISSENSKPKFILIEKKDSVIQIPEKSTWVKFNPGQTGFYRVNYPDNFLSKLEKPISDGTLSSIDRLGIQNDVAALAKAGFCKTSKILQVLKAYSNETNYTVLSGVSANITSIYSLIKFEESLSSLVKVFKQYSKGLFKKQASKLGWTKKEGESHLDSLLRTTMIENMVTFGDEETVKQAQQLFEKGYKDGLSNVLPDLRGAVYSAVLSNGSTEDYQKVLALFEKSEMNEEKVRILRSIGSVKGQKQLKLVLDWGWEHVKRQDTFYLFSSVASNSEGRDLTWKFLQENWKEFTSRYEGGLNMLPHFVKIACSQFTSEEKAKEVEAFFEKNECKEADRAVKQSVETIRTKTSWLKRSKEDLSSYFDSLKV